jgi:hypothetical protein
MKKPTARQLMLAVLVALLTLSFRTTDTRGTSGERQVILPAGQVHEGWYFAGGDQIIIDGTINGDAYIAGGTIDVNGTINGDLIIAGGQLNIGGTVSDDIRGAGGVVRLSGRVGKNVTVAGGTVVITKEAEIAKNLLAAGGDVQLRGTVGQEAKLGAGTVTLMGSVKGSLDAAAERMSVHEGAMVGGDLTVMTKDTLLVTVAPGTVHGKTSVMMREAEMKSHFLGMTTAALWFKALFIISLFATALLLAFILPSQLAETGLLILERPGASALWGFLVLIIVPVVVLILCITVIGMPLGLFLLLLYLWFMYLSQLAFGVALAHKLLGVDGKHGWSLFGTVALGLLLVGLLMFIPYVKTIVMIAGMIFGVGTLSIICKEELASHRMK